MPPKAATEMENSEKITPSRWTPEMDVKLLLAVLDSSPNITKSIDWSEVAKILGKTVEGVRQHLKLLRKSNNKTPNANRTIPDSNGSSQKKPDTASKKRGRNDQNDDGDASATEAKPPSKKRATKSKVKAEE